uniref:Uncharacterized protein n=1 Tax=Cacopsylla melanoneura TaxID=428564 RepID=A0A8D8LIQ5_9HEMI
MLKLQTVVLLYTIRDEIRRNSKLGFSLISDKNGLSNDKVLLWVESSVNRIPTPNCKRVSLIWLALFSRLSKIFVRKMGLFVYVRFRNRSRRNGIAPRKSVSNFQVRTTAICGRRRIISQASKRTTGRGAVSQFRRSVYQHEICRPVKTSRGILRDQH